MALLVILFTAEWPAATLGAVELDYPFVLVLFVLVLFVHSHFIMCLDIIIIILMAKRDKTLVAEARSAQLTRKAKARSVCKAKARPVRKGKRQLNPAERERA